jgi:uroporphyrin-III C-methyltransferase/precorrin-2 dehydrogenase/sirohydrochlorin ferrochelatase
VRGWGIDVARVRVLVVGGGPALAPPVAALAEEGALLTVVAPRLAEDLADAVTTAVVAGAEVRHLPRRAAPDDVDGARLVVVDDPEGGQDDEVARWAQERNLFCLRPGRDGHAVVEDPFAVRRPRPVPGRGRVVLVGGGPGDVGLLTVRGRQALAEADVVVTDRLGPRSVLASLGRDIEVVDVGKTPYHHPVPQPEIERVLVEHALLGKVVVRLKGGDPFLLGRGGEEVQACRAAGVPVEVVPGVTSAFSAPAAADVPVTHRGVARAVAVVSGHDDLEPDVLASWVGRARGTLVVLMGMARLRELSAALLARGVDPATPAAAVRSAWTPQQATCRATLATLADRCADDGIGSPAVVVIGDVAAGIDALPERGP